MAGQPSKAALQRIAVVVPPADWLNGILRAYHDLYRQALTDLGVATIDVPLQAVVPYDAGRMADLLSDLRAFRPQAAMALSVGAWLMACRLPAGRDGWSPNLFTDVLDIPSICIWDGAPLDFAARLLDLPGPGSAEMETPATSRPGVLAALRRELRHPRLIHWSRDSGQTRVMRDLGFLSAGKVLTEISPILPGFMPDPDTTPAEDAAFVGHLNDDPRPWPDPRFAALSREIVEESLRDPDRPIWDVLLRKTGSRPELDPDQKLLLGLRPSRHRLRGASAPVGATSSSARGVTRIEASCPLGPAARPRPCEPCHHGRRADPLLHRRLRPQVGAGLRRRWLRPAEPPARLRRHFRRCGRSRLLLQPPTNSPAKIDLYLTKPALRREIGGAIREKRRLW